MSIASHYKSSPSLHPLTWDEFIEDVKVHGFETGFYEGERGGFEEQIFFNPQNGIIIYAFTYSGRSVNYAVAYGELKVKGNEVEKGKAMKLFKHFQMSDGVIAFSMEAKVLKELLSMRVQFALPWKVKQEMQLMNFDERQRLSPKDQIRRMREKIRECPREMKAIIGFR